MICEGVSVRGTTRLTNTDPHTVIDLLLLVGKACELYMRRNIKGVHVEDVQADEIWQFVYCKRATAVREKYAGGCGDSYCYTAIERNTKLMVAWHMGRRNELDTNEFCWKLAQATKGQFHLSTDGWPAYPMSVFNQMGNRVNYGVVIKIFQEPQQEDRRKYSPSKIIEMKKTHMIGTPDDKKICTSHAERMNGSIRTFAKRMGRLTYCFSKRWGNHQAALGLYFAYYNYCWKHRSLKGQTPAMAHGIENHRWTVRELLEKVLVGNPRADLGTQ